jgi:hypothetical protein
MSGRPDKKSSSDDPVDIQAVYEPAGYWLQTRINPEERREQNAQLRYGDSKLILPHGRCRDGEIAAIYIVDEGGDSSKTRTAENLPLSPLRSGSLGLA